MSIPVGQAAIALLVLASPPLLAQVTADPTSTSAPAAAVSQPAAPAVSLSPATRQLEVSAEEELARARNLFAYGDYGAATSLLSELVLPGRLADELDLIEAHRMLGIALFQLGRPDEAKREFKALLYLDPDTRLDPFLTPPAVVEFFNATRDEIADKLAAVREKKREAAAQRPAPKVTVVERTVQRRGWVANFVPFGYPQFERGAYGWGIFFLTTQLLGTVTTVGAAAGTFALEGPDGFMAPENRELYGWLRGANWTGAGFTALAYIGGTVEAFVSYEHETLQREDVREIPRDQVPGLTQAKE